MIITIIYSNLNIGGIPTKIIDIANTIEKTSPNTTVKIFLQKNNPGDIRSLISNKNVIVIDFNYPLAWGRRAAYILWVWRNIYADKPRAILAFVSPYALPALFTKLLFFWRKTKIIISEDHYTETLIHDMAAPWLQRLGIKILYPLADLVITPTKTIREQLLRLCAIQPNNICIIPNWTSLANIPQKNTKRTWDIIHAGRLVKSKNPLKIVKIMKQYVEAHTNAQCAIIGNGPERTAIMKYISQHNLQKQIEILPETLNISQYLSNAKAFLFLPEKRTEGFPIILLEAMACGAIIFTKTFDGIQETITHGVNGYVFDRYEDIFPYMAKALHKQAAISKIQTHALYYIKKNNSLHNINGYISAIMAK